MSDTLIKNEFVSATLLIKVLTELEQHFKRTGAVSDRLIRDLNAICCDGTVLRACEYLDATKVLRYHSGTRFMYKLTNNNMKARTILPDVNFCTCEYYIRQVLMAQKALLCKHVLAVKIAEATGRVQEERVTDGQLADLLLVQLAHFTEHNST